MALTLAEAAKLSQDDLQRGVLETFVLESVVLDRLPLLTIQGNAYSYNEEATLPGVEFRAVNAGYNESTGTVNQKSESLVILGGDADVDRFIQQTRSNLNDQRATQTRMKVKAATYAFQNTFINGDTSGDANSFDGLKKRLTGSQVVDCSTAGLPVIGSSSADIHAFCDKLDELQAVLDGPADALYMNQSIKQKIVSAARRIGLWTTTRDEFGRQVDAYNGVPLLDIGKTPAGVAVLPQTEVLGGSGAATSSIYAVQFGQDEADQAITGLTNGGVQVRDMGELETKPAFRTRIEFYCGLAVFGARGAARLRGVLNA